MCGKLVFAFFRSIISRPELITGSRRKKSFTGTFSFFAEEIINIRLDEQMLTNNLKTEERERERECVCEYVCVCVCVCLCMCVWVGVCVWYVFVFARSE